MYDPLSLYNISWYYNQSNHHLIKLVKNYPFLFHTQACSSYSSWTTHTWKYLWMHLNMIIDTIMSQVQSLDTLIRIFPKYSVQIFHESRCGINTDNPNNWEERAEQDNCEFLANLCCMVRLYFRKTKQCKLIIEVIWFRDVLCEKFFNFLLLT